MLSNLIYSLLLGMEQGISEFLPISSSGHLAVTQFFNEYFRGNLYFDIVLHMGTLLAVLIFFKKEILSVLKMVVNPLSKKSRKLHYLIIATLVTVILIIPFKDTLEGFFENMTIIGIAFLGTGVINISAQYFINKKKKGQGSYGNSIFVGFMQSLAFIPGISRSGSTIMASLAGKNSPDYSFEFSFLLSIPAILGSFVFETIDLLRSSGEYNFHALTFLLGFIAAFFFGYFSLKILKKIVLSRHYYLFGVYTILLGTAVLIFSGGK